MIGNPFRQLANPGWISPSPNKVKAVLKEMHSLIAVHQNSCKSCINHASEY